MRDVFCVGDQFLTPKFITRVISTQILMFHLTRPRPCSAEATQSCQLFPVYLSAQVSRQATSKRVYKLIFCSYNSIRCLSWARSVASVIQPRGGEMDLTRGMKVLLAAIFCIEIVHGRCKLESFVHALCMI